MVIAADSGSTSTDWRLVGRKGYQEKVLSPGVNPVYQDVDEMAKVIDTAVGPFCGQVDKVWFYGAGVVSGSAAGKVREAFARVFPGCPVYVGTDLEAAATAMLGCMDGVAAILGTGSNTGLWRGGAIVRSIPAGGYILGDEGSGAWIGRRLLSDYVKGLLPRGLEAEFVKAYPDTDYASLVERIYRGPMPSRYLASFSPFLKHHEEDSYVDGLLRDGFRQFFSRNVVRYGSGLPLAVLGSVACAYKDVLMETASEFKVEIIKIEASAGDGLAAFFQTYDDTFVERGGGCFGNTARNR